MEEFKTNVGQGLGIAGLVLGIVSILICFIPCVGVMAIVPGLIGVTLSAIAYNQAVKGNGARGLIIAALVVSILGSSVSILQGVFISSVANHGDRFWHRFEKQVEDETGKSVDQNVKEIGTEMESVLEKLENVDDSVHIDIKIGKKLSDEEFNKLMIDYESLIKETIKLSEKSKNGEAEASVYYAKLALKLAGVHAKLLANSSYLTESQHKKLEEINQKYQKTIDNLKN
jgi:hypothetical protein